MKQSKIILIMAGGTGGHVFPGLAVAAALQQSGFSIYWLGTAQGIESKLVPAAGIPLAYISISGLRGKGWQNTLKAPWKLIKSVMQAIKVLQQVQPDAVLGMGGFAAGPGGLAARILNKPLVIHEQNAVSGYTNLALAYIAKRVLMSFPGTFPAKVNPILTGNPLRQEFFTYPDPEQRFSNRKGAIRLLILGGSQGAAALNKTVPEAIALLKQKRLDLDVKVIHSTGERSLDETSAVYRKRNIKAELFPFIKDMAKAYAWADLCICRAGALTVAEICAIGVGAIFIPYPAAVDDHQTKNAQALVDADAAKMIQQKELTPEKLASLLDEMTSNRQKLISMAQAACSLSCNTATALIVNNIIEVCDAATTE